MDLICVAMRGRNPENPSDRTVGADTEQRLEPNNSGKTNCLTGVQKDNLILQINPSTESGGKQPFQQNRIYDEDGIAPALCRDKSDLLIKTKFNQDAPTSIDKEKHPCLSSEAGGITKGIGIIVPEATKKGFVEINPGDCFDAENPNAATPRGRKMEDKSNCLMANETNFMQYTPDFRIRRLTPVECERLQTVADGFTAHVSNSQRYKMLGNGWNVDTIVHILSYLKFGEKKCLTLRKMMFKMPQLSVSQPLRLPYVTARPHRKLSTN